MEHLYSKSSISLEKTCSFKMKVYGIKRWGVTVWCGSKTERDLILEEEQENDPDCPEEDIGVPVEGEMTEEEFAGLSEFEGW